MDRMLLCWMDVSEMNVVTWNRIRPLEHRIILQSIKHRLSNTRA